MFIRIPKELYFLTRQLNPNFISEEVLQNIKPPNYIPEASKAAKIKKTGEPIEFGAVDAPSVSHCMFQFVYVNFSNKEEGGIWIILTYVGPNSIGGYTFKENKYWSYQGIALDQIASFWCDPTVLPELLKETPPIPWL